MLFKLFGTAIQKPHLDRFFINYRRGADGGYSHALYHRLERVFPKEQLFMDVEGHIAPGADYVEAIGEQVAQCDVLLAVIGPRWIDIIRERRNDPTDFVVVEIRAALAQGKWVIPILVDHAVFPNKEHLPVTIHDLARRNAVALRPERFGTDCTDLVKKLKEAVANIRAARRLKILAEQRDEKKRLRDDARGVSRWNIFSNNSPHSVLEKQDILVSNTLDGTGLSTWEWNVDRNIIDVSPYLDQSLGYQEQTVPGSLEGFLQHLHASDRERLRLALWTVRARERNRITNEFRMRRSDGSYRWYELRANADFEAAVIRCIGILIDITAQKRSQERLLHNAIHDSLTGLPNRELFLDRTYCAIARAHEDNSKPTVLYIDVDTFQSLSRSTDLNVSDSMLLTISRRLSRHLGRQDTLARIGNEQFAVLLSAETEPRHIAQLAERVRRSLRAPMKIADHDVVLTGSIGISVYDGQQATPADLVREAETAMYRAKRSGADRIELYKPEMRGERGEREVIEGDLKQAIEKRQIRVLYQPVMRLGNEQLAGFCAQVRWEHPKLGSLSTAEFLPVAEETGQIAELSSYVVEHAVRQVARWHRNLPRTEDPLFVSINVSSQHLFKQELVEDLRLIIGRESVPKGCLRLEVTESLIMENPEQAVEILDFLKVLGVGVTLDEFGAGYSSLSYLHRLAVDTIKIDCSLISTDSDNKSGAVVLRAALAMARELGKDVVAVGMEKEDDVAYVRALGCDYAQGFFFGEQMTEREVMNLLNAVAKAEARTIFKGERDAAGGSLL